jgi:endoglucanase
MAPSSGSRSDRPERQESSDSSRADASDGRSIRPCVSWAGVRRGINLGNAFDWVPGRPDRLRVEARHLDVIVAAGFDTVRLPVRWSAHAAPTPPFSIDPDFFRAIEETIDLAFARGLEVVVNVHHYDELCADPAGHADRFVALWSQIADHWADRPPTLHFELLNEPRLPMTAGDWNRLLVAALAVVRRSNPARVVVVGPADMNKIDALAHLDLPGDDRLIVTTHYYEPFAFTHQGAPWWPGAERWVGTTWGTAADHDAVQADLERLATWASDRDLRVLIGEFGTYQRADQSARAAWTAHVRSVAEQLDLAWCYWDFATDFGAYDLTTGTWRQPLRAALLEN